MHIPEIRQELDPARLEILSEEVRESADETGELDGNQHYVDLSSAGWSEVRYALKREGEVIAELEASQDPTDTERRVCETLRASEDEEDALWHLDLGVASAVLALNALGAHTSLSCNGGAFGGVHLRAYPSIRFYPGSASISVILDLAREAGVGLGEDEGRAVLYGHSVRDLQKFAAMALERFSREAE